MVGRISKPVMIFAACAMLAASCTKASNTGPLTSSGGSYGSGVTLPTNQPQAKGGSSGPTSGGSGYKSGPGGGYAGYSPPPGYKPYTGGQGSGNLTRGPNDTASLGSNAYFYLNRTVPKLTVEIQAVSGYGPSTATLSLLRQRLQSVADKPGGVDVMPVANVIPGRSTWTIPQVQAVESKYRKHYSSNSDAVIYLIFVNGQPNPSGPIGVAYNASSDVIFEEAIRGASTPLVTVQEIEQACVVHEVGHILSLVNIGYTSPRPHEDSQHPGHSNNPGSVMYWAVDNVGVANLLGGRTAPPDNYDSDDRADLKDVQNRKLIVR
jgi:hypothetical protein